MIYAVIAEAVIIVYMVAVIVVLERSHAKALERADKSLQTMADRVQAPERLPIRETGPFEIPEQKPDDWATVGSINIDPEYGLDD